MSDIVKAPLTSILQHMRTTSPLRQKILRLAVAGVLGALVWKMAPSGFRSTSRITLRTLYWALIRSRGFRNIVLTAILLSIMSRHLFKGLTRKMSFPVSFAIVWYLYYRTFVVSPVRLRCQRTFFNIQVIEKAQFATTKFHPVPWGFNRHSQTILLFSLSHLELWWLNPLRYTKELVTSAGVCTPQPLYWVESEPNSIFGSSEPRAMVDVSQGEEVFVDSKSGEDSSRDSYESGDDPEYMNEPILLLIHGLGNDRDHIALQRYSRAAREAGWRVVVWEYVCQSVTDIDGLTAVINHIAKRYPASPLCAIAWSLGCLYLMKYLTVVGKDTPLVCAIGISGCLSLRLTAEATRDNENRAYWHILQSATKTALRRWMACVSHISDPLRVKLQKAIDTEYDPLRLYDFFQFYTGANARPIDTPFEYLSSSTKAHYDSLVKDIHKVGVTTMLIHSSDDPMVHNGIFNVTEMARASKYIISVNTKRGGHIGFYEGLAPFGKTWDLRISMQFISAVIESLAQVNHILTVLKRVDSTVTKQQSRENLLAAPPQLPGALARICSSASIYAKTPGTRSPFPDSDEAVAHMARLNELYKASQHAYKH